MHKLRLLEMLRTHFDDSELRDICFSLNIDYETLPGTSKGDKSREIIGHLERRDRLPELLEICRQLRPSISWADAKDQSRSIDSDTLPTLDANPVRARSEVPADLLDVEFEHIGDEETTIIRVTAEVYWHRRGFTRNEALGVCELLRSNGIPCRLTEHRDERTPDSVFIGALVPAEVARIALRAIPYQIRYIFRPDYPEAPGGSASGYKIGIGYRSTHLAGYPDAALRPARLSEDELEELTESGLSNVEFHRRLRRITGME